MNVRPFSLTQRHHRASYPAISVENPENSQEGRTVLITGSTLGIGHAVARGFVAAGAACVIITGRREILLNSAVEKLSIHAASTRKNKNLTVIGKVCDVHDFQAIEELWEGLKREDVKVDVLVLNAAIAENIALLDQENGLGQTWKMYEAHVHASLKFSDLFLNQGPSNGKTLIHISSAEAHILPTKGRGAYGASKIAATGMFQHMAEEVSVGQCMILNVHPGAYLTDAAMRNGYTEETLSWDNESLVGAFCVWAATSASNFLHGRFVYAAWDVEELKAMSTRMDKEKGFLKLGLQGVESIGMFEFIGDLQANAKAETETEAAGQKQ